jgi:hypothetical protein
MFKVVDGDTGERIDVRELLGLTEEDFKENPDLLQILKHMNNIKPLENEEESKDSTSGSKTGTGNAQKQRHFKNYDLLKASVQGDEFMTNP